MAALRATVRNGRLVMDVPTRLPEGTVLKLTATDPLMQEESVVESALEAVLGELKTKGLVKSWSFELGEDHQGDAAVFVCIVMNDPPRGALTWRKFKPIYDKVTEELRDRDPLRWPYVTAQLASEQRSARRG